MFNINPWKFLETHNSNYLFIVFDTSAWLRLFRAAPNRVPAFLFNYFNCGYPISSTKRIQREFYKNIAFVEKDVLVQEKKVVSRLGNDFDASLFAVENITKEKRAEVYQQLLSLYGGAKISEMILKAFSGVETDDLVGLTQEEIVQKESEAQNLALEGKAFPGFKDKQKKKDKYGDYLIFAELEKLAIQKEADILFVTFDVKENMYWPHFEEEFLKETNRELLYIDVPSFDKFTDRFGDTANALAGVDIRNEIIASHLKKVEERYVSETGKAVEDYFALNRCYLPAPDWKKAPVKIELLSHKESNFSVDFGTDDCGSAFYDCSFVVEAEVRITYEIFPENRQDPIYQIAEDKSLKGIAQGMITRCYGEPQNISNLEKEHWLDVSYIDFGN